MKRGRTKAAIIGGGRIGQSVRMLLSRNGRQVFVWDRDMEKPHVHHSLSEAVRGASVVFICVPSWGLRSALRSMKPFLSKGAALAAFTKGIERGTRKFAHEVIRDECPKNPVALIGGPFLAEELDRELYGVAVIGTPNRGVFLKIKKLFSGTPARLAYEKDIKSIALAGVMKNLYALGLGIADGLGWGANAKGWLAAQFIDEMPRTGALLGAKPQAMGAAVSDLIASGFSPHSRNRRSGEEILKWDPKSIKSESIASYPSAVALLGGKMKRLPYLSALSGIVLKRKDAHVVFKRFLE